MAVVIAVVVVVVVGVVVVVVVAAAAAAAVAAVVVLLLLVLAVVVAAAATVAVFGGECLHVRSQTGRSEDGDASGVLVPKTLQKGPPVQKHRLCPQDVEA